MSLNKFKKALESECPDIDFSDQDASLAMHNLTGFMSVLIAVNEREKIVHHSSQATNHGN